jgi:hypothetical protein
MKRQINRDMEKLLASHAELLRAAKMQQKLYLTRLLMSQLAMLRFLMLS